MSEARTIEDNHTVGLRCEVNEAARFEIFNLRAVSVNEQERITCSAFDVMQAHPVDLKELANRRMTLFCVARLSPSA